MNIYKAKTIFLELAWLEGQKKEKARERKNMLNDLDMELNVAERLLDNLAKNRNTNIQMLFKLNKKIEELKNNVNSMRQAS